MAMQSSELEADTLEILVLDAATLTREHGTDRAAGSGVAGERILDAEEVAAELMCDSADEVHSLGATREGGNRARPAPPPRAAIARPVPTPPPTAASPILDARLEAAEAEVTRLRRQLRARDAYLTELQQALQASTRQLEASGLGSVEDAYKLLGRLRGQAFRIAELESDLRQMEQRLSRLSRLVPTGFTT
jgi:hypothetical protein